MDGSCPSCEYESDDHTSLAIHYGRMSDDAHEGHWFAAVVGEDRLRELYAEQSRKQIARDYGVTVKVITKALRRMGVDFRSTSEAVKKYYDDHGHHEGNEPKDPYLTHHSQGYEEIRHWSQRVYVHRLAAIAWFGYDAVDGKHVHHKNNIPWDNREENLETLTASDHRSHHTQEMWDEGYGIAER